MPKTAEEKIAVQDAWENGQEIQVFIDNVWIYCGIPSWRWSQYDYRVKFVPIPDSINWEAINLKWNFVARDKNGEIYLYDKKPYLTDYNSNIWKIANLSYYKKVTDIINVKVGNLPWNESLIERPNHV